MATMLHCNRGGVKRWMRARGSGDVADAGILPLEGGMGGDKFSPSSHRHPGPDPIADTRSSKLNKNFTPQIYAFCMTHRRKIQVLCVTLMGMIAFGVYRIWLALSTGIVETRLMRASWIDNPAGFVFYFAVLIVGTAAFSTWLFVIIHDERFGRHRAKSQSPTFDRPEYRSSVPDNLSRDERP